MKILQRSIKGGVVMSTVWLAFIFSIPIFVCVYLLYLRRPVYTMNERGQKYSHTLDNRWLYMLLGMFVVLEVLAFLGFNFQMTLQTELILFLAALLVLALGYVFTGRH